MENEESNEIVLDECDKSTLIPGIVADIDGVLVEIYN